MDNRDQLLSVKHRRTKCCGCCLRSSVQRTDSAASAYVRVSGRRHCRQDDLDGGAIVSPPHSRSRNSSDETNPKVIATGSGPLRQLSTLSKSSSFSESEREKPEDYGHVILDKFTTFEEVRETMREEGVEECNVIIAIDYTMSNITQGKTTNDGRSLHDLNHVNPYEQVILALGETLGPLQADDIPVFGFGDSKVRDTDIFALHSKHGCQTFYDVYQAYRGVTACVKLGGRTNFAPVIFKAMEIVQTSQKVVKFHILVIIADGQVVEEQLTKEAIQQASQFPLSIVVIGVGDGPWGLMEEWDDRIKDRQFDNFQFVNFHKVTTEAKNPQAAIALAALMEIPEQYKQMKTLGML